jgi:multiple sugar transport system ATP-binding protein
VAFVEDLGASLLLHVDVDARPPRLDADGIGVDPAASDLAPRGDRARVRAMVDGFSTIHQGDRLPIVVDLDRMHWFDPRTGLAIGAAS